MAVTTADILAELHGGLRARPTPQLVAARLVMLGATGWLDARPARELRHLAVMSAGSFAPGSSMSGEWRRHPGLDRAYQAAATAMVPVWTAAHTPAPAPADPADPGELERWLGQALPALGLTGPADPVRRKMRRAGVRKYGQTWPGKPHGRRGDVGGHTDTRTRLDAAERQDQLPGLRVRGYRKAVRAVLHLQQRTAVLAAERDRETVTAIGKSRLAYTIDRETFTACPRTAAFVAYYTARLGMRTVFTAGQQARPMDELAEALLRAALDAPTGRPEALARVLTRPQVLDRLTDAQRGELLGVYYEQMVACARTLRRTFDHHRDRGRMVVRPGDDSSTWNAASRAFNQLRTGWLNLLTAMNLEHVLEKSLPGKVPALMAADVYRWHVSSGGRQHPDIGVWTMLPRPWDVVLGDASCPAATVRDWCEAAGIDPASTGWTQPYRQDGVEPTSPARDLVHGVTVTSPLLAGMMRGAGVFSGQH